MTDRMMRQSFALAVSVALLLGGAGQARAGAEVVLPVRPQPQVVAMPDAQKIVLLLRTSLTTLNNALQTGNYTVLRDMGAPGFRKANSAARLSQIFVNLVEKNVDMSVVSVQAPKLSQAPTLDQQKGMLHLKGYFPGQPTQINFELLYKAVAGRWRLFGMSVQPGAVPLRQSIE
jgi:hypothetical protein